MTAIVAWLHGESAFLCADSAFTSAGTPQDAFSSFGEAQQVDRLAVQEGAFKFLRIASDVLVGVAGDAERGLAFVQILLDDEVLAKDRGALRDLLESLLPAFLDEEDNRSFELVFAHLVAGRPVLTLFTTRRGLLIQDDADPRRTFVIGSLPPELKSLVARAATSLKRSDLPGDVVHAAMLGFLQALGVTTPMPEHGVGGAYFGAALTGAGVKWQPDLVHVLYVPRTFEGLPALADHEQLSPPSEMKKVFESVRTMVRHEAGVVVSSVAPPGVRVLVPATSLRSEEEWRRAVEAGSPEPIEVIVPDARGVVFLSKAHRKVVVLVRPHVVGRVLSIERVPSGGVALRLSPGLVQELELAPAHDSFDLLVVMEPLDRGDAVIDRRCSLKLS